MPTQHGLSLIELMIAMALGMAVVLAALALLGAARVNYVAVTDGALVQDSGRYALEVLGRSIRQANYVPHEHAAFANFSALDASRLEPGVSGLDNHRPGNRTAALCEVQANSDNHGSDVLVLRYFGSPPEHQAESGILNCAGFAVAAPTAPVQIATIDDAELQRDWSIFYVAKDSSGEPELRCKYVAKDSGWNSVALVRGVEAFQVLYGIADTATGAPVQYRNAAQILPQQWRQVTAVRVALLIRGEQASADTTPAAGYALFGAAYNNPLDHGTVITRLKPPNRKRKLFQSTIQLRNAAP